MTKSGVQRGSVEIEASAAALCQMIGGGGCTGNGHGTQWPHHGDFASLMQGSELDHLVVNQTGLDGKWDFLLSWTPDETQFIQMPGAQVRRLSTRPTSSRPSSYSVD